MKLGKKGFTLAELLLAAAILAFALCAILLTYISITVLIVTSKNMNIATNQAMAFIEEVRDNPFAAIESYDGFTVFVDVLPSGALAVDVEENPLGYYKLTVNVSWIQSNRNMNTQLVTIVSNR
jgi:prepilin-type N-terminal cleavage/methylation domain-containing protein